MDLNNESESSKRPGTLNPRKAVITPRRQREFLANGPRCRIHGRIMDRLDTTTTIALASHLITFHADMITMMERVQAPMAISTMKDLALRIAIRLVQEATDTLMMGLPLFTAPMERIATESIHSALDLVHL
jgi:hypothetical protein